MDVEFGDGNVIIAFLLQCSFIHFLHIHFDDKNDGKTAKKLAKGMQNYYKSVVFCSILAKNRKHFTFLQSIEIYLSLAEKMYPFFLS